MSHVIASLCLVLVLLLVSTAFAGGYLPRVGVRDGRFVVPGPDGQPRPFHPRGFNYIRLESVERPWHWTFNESYDAAVAEACFQDLQGRGFNVVRVFVSPGIGRGVVESEESETLSPLYMANVCDFLKRAGQHGLYVVFAMDGPPGSKRYNEIAGRTPTTAHHRNRRFLHEPSMQAKARFMADFVAAIAERDPKLLPVALSYELENETHLNAGAAPFDQTEGTFELAGRSYDLSSEQELQRLADDGVRMAANFAVEAVKAVDPDALVGVDVFTFAAVGRGGPGRLRTDETRDRRFPARPLALVDSRLDYLDIHLYSHDEPGLARDLVSIEWEQFGPACRAAGKPVIMGEFGAFKSPFPEVDAAAAAMSDHVRRVMDLGFAGWMYWTYDTDEQPYIWNARMADGTVLEAMTAVRGYGTAADEDAAARP